MSDPQIARLIRDFNRCLLPIKRDQDRFCDNPLRALGAFAEGDFPETSDRFSTEQYAPRFLGVEPDCHRIAEPRMWTYQHDVTYNGPYFVYLSPNREQTGAAIGREIDRQLTSLNSVLPSLIELVRSIPVSIACGFLPDGLENWWKVLFYLAIHRPQSFLRADRVRWVTFTGPPPGSDVATIPRNHFPHRGVLQESRAQLYWRMATFSDIVPGIIWSLLSNDVFTSTVRAVELLVEELESTLNPPSAPDEAVVCRTFTEVHRQFESVAQQWREMTARSMGQSLSELFGDIRLVKVGNSFRLPPAEQWCGFPMHTLSEPLILSRRHADAEYLLHSGLPDRFRQLSRLAGTALPPRISDHPVMFHRQNVLPSGVICDQSVGGWVLDPDPLACWVRFVCNVLLRDDPTGREVSVQYQEPATNNPWRDIYGFVTFPNGFYFASARAIEVAGLLTVKESQPPIVEKSEVHEDVKATPKKEDVQLPKIGRKPIGSKKNDPKDQLQKNVYDSIIARRRAGQTPSQIIDFLKSPDGKQLDGLVAQHLKNKPLKSNGKTRKRIDVIRAADRTMKDKP